MYYRKIDSTRYSCASGHDTDQRIDRNSAYSSANGHDCENSSKQWLDIKSAANPADAFTINDGLCLPEHSGLDISWTRHSDNTCTSAGGLKFSQCSSGTSLLNPADSNRENGWGYLDVVPDFLSSPSPATTNVQSVEPSGDTSILAKFQWVEKQQSFDSGRQSSYRSNDGNHSSRELHPSQSSGPEIRQTSQPVPNITIGPTALANHFLPLFGSGTIGYNTTESPPSPSLTTTTVQPIESSSGTLTPLQVIELEDIEVTCLLCGGTFLGYQASSHLRENHPTLVYRNDRALCPLCTTTGTTTPAKEVTNFCRHFQKHHKVLRFKCLRCNYKALERWNVERHVQKMRGKSMC
ncbi:hypothetical protein ARMGADRAFT_28957 [Armillaria gallica]|uniref:C2H2-type domain-containing protein n=1 Tax=Armillaria gallica TaxID=47427 RepID=A0A2H3EZ53_ARMGA|nr:hypothetical protein ARMGADRAFT_28957 [Armillaria gallica]